MCGVRDNLQAHHIKFRSNGGDDADYNLITLCATHHDMIHRRELVLIQEGTTKDIDANKRITFEKLQ
jgi:predicted restriction endonuclease